MIPRLSHAFSEPPKSSPTEEDQIRKMYKRERRSGDAWKPRKRVVKRWTPKDEALFREFNRECGDWRRRTR